MPSEEQQACRIILRNTATAKKSMAYLTLSKTMTAWYTHHPAKDDMPTLVFIHGWVHNHTVWKRMEHIFHKKGFGTFCIDLPGHGKSSVPNDPREYTMDHMADVCAKIIKRRKIAEPILVGHSLGSMVAQYMYKKVQPQAMILIGTSYITPIRDAIDESRLEIAYIEELTNRLNKRIPAKQEHRMMDFSRTPSHNDILIWLRGASATSAKGLISCFGSILAFDSRSLLKKITCPVLLLVGQKDIRTPLRRIKQMRKFLVNARAVSIEVIPDHGHNVNLTAPKEVANEILDFLKVLEK